MIVFGNSRDGQFQRNIGVSIRYDYDEPEPICAHRPNPPLEWFPVHTPENDGNDQFLVSIELFGVIPLSLNSISKTFTPMAVPTRPCEESTWAFCPFLLFCVFYL